VNRQAVDCGAWLNLHKEEDPESKLLKLETADPLAAPL